MKLDRVGVNVKGKVPINFEKERQNRILFLD